MSPIIPAVILLLCPIFFFNGIVFPSILTLYKAWYQLYDFRYEPCKEARRSAHAWSSLRSSPGFFLRSPALGYPIRRHAARDIADGNRHRVLTIAKFRRHAPTGSRQEKRQLGRRCRLFGQPDLWPLSYGICPEDWGGHFPVQGNADGTCPDEYSA